MEGTAVMRRMRDREGKGGGGSFDRKKRGETGEKKERKEKGRKKERKEKNEKEKRRRKERRKKNSFWFVLFFFHPLHFSFFFHFRSYGQTENCFLNKMYFRNSKFEIKMTSKFSEI